MRAIAWYIITEINDSENYGNAGVAEAYIEDRKVSSLALGAGQMIRWEKACGATDMTPSRLTYRFPFCLGDVGVKEGEVGPRFLEYGQTWARNLTDGTFAGRSPFESGVNEQATIMELDDTGFV